MRLSIETYSLRNVLGDKEALRAISAAGFDAYDYSMYRVPKEYDMLGDDWLSRAAELKALAESLHIYCNQAHAPVDFKFGNAISLSDNEFLRLVRSIELAAFLGADNIVVHPIETPEKQSFLQYNREFYLSLLPFAQRFGINIAIENLIDWEDNSHQFGSQERLSEFVLSLGSGRFKVCIDIGHAAIVGLSPKEIVGATDSRLLAALHIHDNDLMNDAHLLPTMGKINFSELSDALNKVNYKGDFTYEVKGFLDRLTFAQLPVALKAIEQAGRVLVNQIIK